MARTVVLAERESSFVATVQESAPYRWTALDSSPHLIGSLHISHLAYFPPTSPTELRAYTNTPADAPEATVHSVRAVVRTLTASNKLEDFVIACFPLDVRRLEAADVVAVPPLANSTESASTSHSSDTPAGPSPVPLVSSLLPSRHDAFDSMPSSFVLPCSTDIAAGLNVHVGLDGMTELRVEGPGRVVFSGEEKIGMLRPSRREYDFHRSEDHS